MKRSIKNFLLLVGVQFFIVQSVVGLEVELGELAKKLGGLKASLGKLASELKGLKKALKPKVAKKPISTPKEIRSLSLLLIDEIKKGKELVDSEKRELKPRPASMLSKQDSVLAGIKKGGHSLHPPRPVVNLKPIKPKKTPLEAARQAFIERKMYEIKGFWDEEAYAKYPAFMTLKIKQGLMDGSFKLLDSESYRAKEVDEKFVARVFKLETKKEELGDEDWTELTREYWKIKKETLSFKQDARAELRRQATCAWDELGDEGQKKIVLDFIKAQEPK